MEERKSMGGAIVDVFDAAVTLVKSEISGVARRVGDVAKAKGIGVVLLLASSGPLILGLVFLILAVYFGLVRLGLGWWSAALLIALFSFALTGALIFLGIKRLGAEVKTDDDGPSRRSGPMSEDEMLEARYQAEQKALKEGQKKEAQITGAPVTQTSGSTGSGYKVADTGSKPATSTPGGQSIQTPAATQTHSTPKSEPGRSNTTGGVDMTRDPDLHTAGETRVVAEGEGRATVRVEGGTTTLPVFESKPDGEAQVYGSGLNKKIDGSDTHDDSSGHGNSDHSSHGGHGHGGHDHDPNLQNPVVLKDAPGITVSTTPTYRDDMNKKEN
ncbi:MAG: hypothetical protein JWQ08_1901 [Deinococcus sp.]|nr:hypothetical protein [Deinococcus sp.]